MKRSNFDNMPPFGKKLMKLRQSRNLRQEDLAKVLGVSRTTISYYEGKAKNPTTEFVRKIADYFGVSTDQLLKDDCISTKKPGPQSKLELQLELIRKLPREKQKAISTVLDMALHNV